MAVGPARTVVRSLTTIKKGASVASLTLKQYGDGSYEFLDTNGNIIRPFGLEAQKAFEKLYDAIDALV